jgi:hypothetical protein
MSDHLTLLTGFGETTAQISDEGGLLLMAPDRILIPKDGGAAVTLPAKSFRIPNADLTDLAELLLKAGYIPGSALSLYAEARRLTGEPTAEYLAALGRAVGRCNDAGPYAGSLETAMKRQADEKAAESGEQMTIDEATR